ncbi:MAG: SCO family protein [Planctomycetota bacterium]|nr:SCO family protein [Planctomycetota bacterium]MDA1179739.1 SCO family protein [Planctomycetota bacterium]
MNTTSSMPTSDAMVDPKLDNVQPPQPGGRAVRFWLALLFFFCGLMLLWFAGRAGRERTGASSEPRDTAHRAVLVDFALSDQMANRFESKSLQGKYWLASFFFASCPSVCPALNYKIQELQREFTVEDLEFVSITCDPANDTSTRLYEYSKRFNADAQKWHFLTGDMTYISRIANDMFQVSVTGLTHSDRLILMDPDGHVVDTYRSSDPVEFTALKRTLKKVLETSTETSP